MRGCEKLILLDVDGTVFPYNPYYKALHKLRERYDCVGKYFEPEALWNELRFGGDLKRVFFTHFKEILREDDCPPVGKLFDEFCELSKRYLSELRLRRGVKKLINTAEEHGWCIVYTTNSSNIFTEKQLREFNLLHNGNFIWPGYSARKFGLRGVEALKPSGKLFDAIVERYSSDVVIVVGDSLITEGLFGKVGSRRKSLVNFVLPPVWGKVVSFRKRLLSEVNVMKFNFGLEKTQEMADTARILRRNGEIIYPASFKKVVERIKGI